MTCMKNNFLLAVFVFIAVFSTANLYCMKTRSTNENNAVVENNTNYIYSLLDKEGNYAEPNLDFTLSIKQTDPSNLKDAQEVVFNLKVNSFAAELYKKKDYSVIATVPKEVSIGNFYNEPLIGILNTIPDETYQFRIFNSVLDYIKKAYWEYNYFK
jgi:hypothetical protein